MLNKGKYGGYIINGKEIRYMVLGSNKNDGMVAEKGYLSEICDGVEVQDMLSNNKVVRTFRPHTIRKLAKDADLQYNSLIDVEECFSSAEDYANKLNRAWRTGCDLKALQGDN